jgi:density-regulated protein DRP1
MAEEATLATPAVEPIVVQYDPVTGALQKNTLLLAPPPGCADIPPCRPAGVPAEFNEFLPKDCEEYKKWKAQGAGVEAEMAQLAVADDGGADAPAAAAAAPPAEPEKKASKKKKNQAPCVVLERNTRNKKKCITTITGLDHFGVKLAEASKLFGKKFASGASVTKNAEGQGQIDVQGDFLDQAVELILKQFKEVGKPNIFYLDGKKKEPYFPEDE